MPLHFTMNRSERRMFLKKSVTKKTTAKLVDRLTYNPKKHKQKHNKKLRQQLQDKTIPDVPEITPPVSLLFASFNINGLGLETAWSVEQLLTTRGYDVSHKTNNKICFA